MKTQGQVSRHKCEDVLKKKKKNVEMTEKLKAKKAWKFLVQSFEKANQKETWSLGIKEWWRILYLFQKAK